MTVARVKVQGHRPAKLDWIAAFWYTPTCVAARLLRPKQSVLMIAKDVLLPGWRQRLRKATAFARAWPDFVILGGMKCGTTSLYAALVEHPQIVSAQLKEV